MPCTGMPRRLSGSAMRPVPIPSSRAGPPSASAARKLTAGSTTAGSNSSGHRRSYRSAIHSSNCSPATGSSLTSTTLAAPPVTRRAEGLPRGTRRIVATSVVSAMLVATMTSIRREPTTVRASRWDAGPASHCSDQLAQLSEPGERRQVRELDADVRVLVLAGDVREHLGDDVAQRTAAGEHGVADLVRGADRVQQLVGEHAAEVNKAGHQAGEEGRP